MRPKFIASVVGLFMMSTGDSQGSFLIEDLVQGVSRLSLKRKTEQRTFPKQRKHEPTISLVGGASSPLKKKVRLLSWPDTLNNRSFHGSSKVLLANTDEVIFEETTKDLPITEVPFINPMDDVAFKNIFTSPENEKVVITVLNEILQLEGDNAIERFEVLQTENLPQKEKGKKSFIDVVCRDHKGRCILIEMQRSLQEAFDKRLVYYASEAYTGQLFKGQKYVSLDSVYAIEFTDFNFSPHKKSYISRHAILDTETHENDFKGLHFIVINLKKFEQEKRKINTPMGEFLYFLKNWRKITKVPENTKIRPIYEAVDRHVLSSDAFWSYADRYFEEMIAAQTLETLQRNTENLQKNTENLQKNIENLQKNMKEGKEEGVKEGIEKGKKEGIKEASLEIAKRLLKKNLSSEEVAATTDLSLEDIKTLQ